MSFGYYQRRCVQWAIDCLGLNVVKSRTERALRFAEESLELVQSLDLTKEQVQMLVDRVYSRPKEKDPQKEVGGVMVTLAVLCDTNNIALGTAAEEGLGYCLKNINKIRDKHRQKEIEGVSVKLMEQE